MHADSGNGRCIIISMYTINNVMGLVEREQILSGWKLVCGPTHFPGSFRKRRLGVCADAPKLDEPGVTVYVLVVEHHQTDSYNLRRVMNVSAAWSYAFYWKKEKKLSTLCFFSSLGISVVQTVLSACTMFIERPRRRLSLFSIPSLLVCACRSWVSRGPI